MLHMRLKLLILLNLKIFLLLGFDIMVKLKVFIWLSTLFGLFCGIDSCFKDAISAIPSAAVLIIFLVFSGFVYFATNYFFESPLAHVQNKYAQQILIREFNEHCLHYTQYKLIELYRSKEYTLFTQKMAYKPCMPYEKINFSDEE